MNYLSDLNIWAILVAAIAYFALGALWYSPILFSKTWVELNKIVMTDESKKMAPMSFLVSFLMMVVVSFSVGLISHELMISTLNGGIKLGLLCGGGFCVTSIAINYVYLNKPMMLYFIDGGYQLLGTTLVSVIIALWH